MLRVLLASNEALFNAFYKTFNEFQERHDELYQLDVTNDELKAIFQKHAVKTPIFRKKPEWDCSTCRSVLVNIAKVVAIDDNYNKVSPFEKFLEKYDLSNYLFLRDMFQEFINLSKTKDIRTLWNSKGSKMGTAENIEPDTGLVFHHFHVDVDERFVQRHIGSVSDKIYGLIATINNYVDHLNVLQDVMWLIEEGHIYRGTEKIKLLDEAYKLLKKYREVSKQTHIDSKIFAFKHIDSIAAYFNSDVISTLIDDIVASNGDIEEAVECYNKKVAPANYMQSKTTFVTPAQVRETEKILTQFGYDDFTNGFKYAEPQDIRILDIIWTNRQVKGGLLSDLLQDNIKPIKLKEDKIAATITFAQFLELLKNAKQVEVDKNLLQKMVLIKDTFNRPVYKWDNHISFCYETGLADVDFVTKKVKEKGGVVDALIRFSLWWKNLDDLDLHLRRKDGAHVCYDRNEIEGFETGFKLDIDMNVRDPICGAVESIFSREKSFEDIGQEFVVFVHNFKKREKRNKCILTVYIDNQPVYIFKFMNPPHDESITFIKFKINKDYKFVPIWLNNEYLKSSAGISNADFVEIDTILLSPNYWGANKGNKHIFFLKRGESIDTSDIRPYNIEQLRFELLKHRKVLQILSRKVNIRGNPQLVGYGISFAKKRKIPIRVNGKPIFLVIDPTEEIKGERNIVERLAKNAKNIKVA